MFKCNQCSFFHANPVLPVRNSESDILVIIDTPSKFNDWDYGKKFSSLFTKWGLRNYNIAHLNRCYKEDNSNPEKPKLGSYGSTEINNCFIHLQKFIETLPNVKYIFLLGMNAGNIFMRPEVAGEVVGKYVEKNGRFYYTTYNPADVNQRPWLYNKVRDHFKRFFKHFYKNKGLIKPHIPVEFITEIKHLDKLREKFKKLSKSDFPYFTFDIESRGLDVISKDFKILTVSFSFSSKKSYVIPLYHKENKYPIINNINEVKLFLNETFNNMNIRGVAHNAKFDIKGLLKGIGVEVNNLGFDTQLAWHVLFNDEKKGLKDIVYKLTDYGGYEKEIDKNKIENYEQIQLDTLMVYNGYDTALTYKLFKYVIPWVKKRGAEVLCYEIYPEVTMAVVDIDLSGLKINKKKLMAYKLSYLRKIENLKLKINSYPESKIACKNLNVEELNIDSTQHLQELIFNVLKIKKRKDSTGGTDKDSLELYSRNNNHQVLKDLLDYSPIEKLYSTYLKSIDTEWVSDDGLTHPNLNLIGTENGRPSCNKPNLLTLPRIKWYKEMFEPFDDDYVFIHSDYSQMEIRVLTSYSNDSVMTDIIVEKRDPHIETASSMFNCKPSDVSKTQRQSAKPVNFGISYGAGASSLARSLTLDTKKNVSLETAQKYMDSYFDKYKGNAKFIDSVKEFVRKNGYIQNIFGRRRNLKKAKFGNTNAIREGINAIIQGTANELMFYSLGKIYKWLKKESIDAKLVLTVYDSVVLAVRKDLNIIRRVASKVQEIMENPPYNSMRVPVEADVEIGFNYGNLYNYDCKKDIITIDGGDVKNGIPPKIKDLKSFLTI